jgi:predicted nucleic acid-binding Zn ribbon protein
MPIYEYRRPDGTTFELQQSFSEEALTVDPDTGVPVERVLHPPAVHFKGKGFYNTDYGTRKRQRETAAAAEGSSGKDSSAKDPSSKDSSSKEGASSSGEGPGSSSSGEGAKGEKGASSKDAGKSAPAKPAAAKKD